MTRDAVPADGPSRRRPTAGARAGRGIPRVLLVLYGFALTAIALWPTPVDRGAGPFLRAITDAVPWLTYGVIEFSSNVVLFVPLGVLLTLLLPRRRLFVPLVALLVTAMIESAQGLLLAARTPSLLDILANTAGAVLGWAIVLFVQRARRR